MGTKQDEYDQAYEYDEGSEEEEVKIVATNWMMGTNRGLHTFHVADGNRFHSLSRITCRFCGVLYIP